MEQKQIIDVICIGQVLIDCIVKGWDYSAAEGRVQKADSITLSPGGDAYNESIILSRLGHKVQTLCGLGDDLAGNILRDKLAESGVDVQRIILNEEAKTPIANLLIDKHGERKSINSEASKLPHFHLEEQVLDKAKIVSLASLFRAPFLEPAAVLEICKKAKENGSIISADTKLPSTKELTLEDMRESLNYIDYIFPNESEAEFYSGKTEYREMAEVFLDYGVKNVIIKLGKQGCFVKNREEEFYVPALEVNAVDATGAGDNFVAGFLSSILQGCDLRTAAEFATECAAICVQSIGATTGAVEDFLRKAY